MARTPSMTVEQAELELGPRGKLHVDSNNRSTVKKWLTAKGFDSRFVAGLSVIELANAYNKTDGSGLDAIERKWRNAADDIEDILVNPTPAPVSPGAGDGAIDLLRQLLLNGWQPGLDENRVRAIVQESIAGIAPRVIEIHRPDADPIKIDGLVHPQFEKCLKILSAQGPNGYHANIMLVGPAGCGKTYLAAQLAKALGVDSTFVGGTAGASEGDLVGRLLPVGENGTWVHVPSEAIKLYERGNALICFDEMDGFDPNMLMVANMPLANGSWYCHLRADQPRFVRGDNVYFIATANTYGTGANPLYAGRNQLDAATLDRFIIISVDYDKGLEESIAAAGGLTAAESAGIWELRDRTRENQVRRVIGTRAFQKASVLKACGLSWREIRDNLLEGWTRDEKAKVGV